MSRKHCFCIGFIVSILSVTNGANINNNSPLQIPAAMLSYLDEHFASLTSDLTRRVEELESRQAEDARRIDILEHLHASDVDQMMVMRRGMVELRTDNEDLHNQVGTLQKQLDTQQTSTTKTNAATTAVDYNTSNVVPHTPEVLLENISSGWTEDNNVTETNSKPWFRRDSYGNGKWEKNLNRITRTGLTTNDYAFHAILGHTLNDPGIEHAIAFENIITMLGGYYSKNTGAFSCLQAGVYAFHWCMRSLPTSSYMYTELVRNGDVIGTAVAYHASTGSASAVVQLSVGDEVWVRVGTHSSGADIELNTSMFSGYLIK
ncbi:uncharacterized protein LOC110466610 [Mizuhopecten yessoensis]|uniref:Complement C1q-like protein 2 n=1 Tax=Mizuhopecten yessoensis TaxID=6573 RepID=A0A210PNP1_MIZYE|nr:uncharacterized protein LOC110466610 [Mizuhopecten yessoensis]OWF38119.1 Complement C1q-like protein 2 [Mizuhopecten yessoensis]